MPGDAWPTQTAGGAQTYNGRPRAAARMHTNSIVEKTSWVID